MSRALEIYTRRYADRLTSETKQILMSLPDDAVRLVHAYFFAPVPSPALPDEPDVRAQIRHAVPTLNALSNQELDVVCKVAHVIEDMDDDEYFLFAEMLRMPGGT